MWEVVGSISFHLVLYLFLDSPKNASLQAVDVSWTKRSPGASVKVTEDYILIFQCTLSTHDASYSIYLLCTNLRTGVWIHPALSRPSLHMHESAQQYIAAPIVPLLKCIRQCGYGPYIQDSRLLYYHIREIKRWLRINHITVHNNTYSIF